MIFSVIVRGEKSYNIPLNRRTPFFYREKFLLNSLQLLNNKFNGDSRPYKTKHPHLGSKNHCLYEYYRMIIDYNAKYDFCADLISACICCDCDSRSGAANLFWLRKRDAIRCRLCCIIQVSHLEFVFVIAAATPVATHLFSFAIGGASVSKAVLLLRMRMRWRRWNANVLMVVAGGRLDRARAAVHFDDRQENGGRGQSQQKRRLYGYNRCTWRLRLTHLPLRAQSHEETREELEAPVSLVSLVCGTGRGARRGRAAT